MNLRLIIIGFLSISFTLGCSTGRLLEVIPDQTVEFFEQAVPAAVAIAKAQPEATPGQKLSIRKKILLAPVVMDWAFPGAEGRDLPPLWQMGEGISEVQSFTDSTYEQVSAGLQSKGYEVVSNQYSKSAGSIGSEPSPPGSSDSYVSKKSNFWKADDFERLAALSNDIGTILFVRIYSQWIYNGHSKINGESVTVYNVASVPVVTVCVSKNDCETARVPDNKPLLPKMYVPSSVTSNISKRDELNKLAIKYVSKYYSQVVLAFVDNIAGQKQ